MGGFPSEEKEKEEVIDEEVFMKSKNNINSKNFNDIFERYTTVTPHNELSTTTHVENYGVLPDLVIMKIALYMPLDELVNVYSTCKLFYRCSNSNRFWNLFFENTFKKGKKADDHHIPYKIIFNEEDNNNENNKNWKREVFLRRYFTDESYRRFYQQVSHKDGTEVDAVPLKTVMLGPPNAGKSAFCLRVIRDEFHHHYAGTTIGAAFFTNTYRNVVTNGTFKVELWDTLGFERYRKDISPMYYRGTDIVFFCFSLTDRNSFFHSSKEEHCFPRIFEKMKKGFKKGSVRKYPIVILLGLKSDLKEDYGTERVKGREVSYEEVIKFMKENEGYVHGYVENSSRDRKNIMLSVGLALDMYMKFHFKTEN